MTAKGLVAVVERARAAATIGALREEGVYDDERAVYECGEGAVAIPVTRAPTETAVREVIRDQGADEPRTLADLLAERGWSESELERAPGSWAVIGDVVLVRVAECPRPGEVGEALLAMHGGADTVLAREGITGPHREPEVRVLAGDGDTETVHREHGTEYALDLAAVMFSPGNKAERVAMGERVGRERVLDMFAGIGYFTLPMARGDATVTAVEHNPTAFRYLVENVVRNEVQEHVESYRADCREVVDGLPDGAFDRVVMGHYDAHEYLDSGLAALAAGGTVHMHAVTPERLLPDRPTERLERGLDAADRAAESVDIRRVKGYSEGVAHVVVDAVVT